MGVLGRVFGARPPDDLFWITAELAQSERFSSRAAAALGRYAIGAVLDLRADERHDLAPLGKAGLHYLHLAVADEGAPTLEELSRAADWARQEMGDDRKVLVHCRSTGASLTVVGALLLRMGYTMADVVPLLQERCGSGLSEAQSAALRRYADAVGR
jgi:rhodanese-related sulfurtransferase